MEKKSHIISRVSTSTEKRNIESPRQKLPLLPGYRSLSTQGVLPHKFSFISQTKMKELRRKLFSLCTSSLSWTPLYVSQFPRRKNSVLIISKLFDSSFPFIKNYIKERVKSYQKYKWENTCHDVILLACPWSWAD